MSINNKVPRIATRKNVAKLSATKERSTSMSYTKVTFGHEYDHASRRDVSLPTSANMKEKPINDTLQEIPVIVDDVTKWISGINENTTCRDVIRVILERETNHFQVWESIGKL